MAGPAKNLPPSPPVAIHPANPHGLAPPLSTPGTTQEDPLGIGTSPPGDVDMLPQPGPQTNPAHAPLPLTICPFHPTCPFIAPSKQSLVLHVDRVHVSAGQIPPRLWLMSEDKWACTSCLRLVPNGSPCRNGDCSAAPLLDEPFQRPGLLPPPGGIVSPAFSPLDIPFRAETPLSPDDLLTTLSQSRSTLAHIPEKALPAVTESFLRVLTSFNDQLSPLSLQDLLLWPTAVLPVPARGGKGLWERNVRQLVRAAQDYPLQASGTPRPVLGAQAPPPRRTRQASGSISEETKRSVKAAVQDGALSLAARQLLSSGLADTSDPRVTQRLADLHPPEPFLIIPPGSAGPLPPPFHLPPGSLERLDLITAGLRSFRPGSKPGPSGLRPAHLLAMTNPVNPLSAPLLLQLDRFVGLALSGSLPPFCTPLLGAANLIALRKRGPPLSPH